jgi:N-methylhydantoinase B/oxoprolinase/acetone carboxylase alpha subunit
LTRLILHPGDAVAVETPGAGGYGSPKERPREKLAEDLCSEKFTRRCIENHYGSDMLASISEPRQGEAVSRIICDAHYIEPNPAH